jgi:hypothetical protein
MIPVIHTHGFTHTCAADTHGHLTDLTPENVEAGGGVWGRHPRIFVLAVTVMVVEATHYFFKKL